MNATASFSCYHKRHKPVDVIEYTYRVFQKKNAQSLIHYNFTTGVTEPHGFHKNVKNLFDNTRKCKVFIKQLNILCLASDRLITELGGQFDGSVSSTKNQEHLSVGRLFCIDMCNGAPSC